MTEQLVPLFKQHLANYPEMQPKDLLKLLFQRNFGCEHLLPKDVAVLARLKQEWNTVPQNTHQPLTEPLGNGLVRLHLAAAKAQGASPELVARLFCLSAKTPALGMAAMETEIALTLQLCEEGLLPFSKQQMQAELTTWDEQGRPPVSHSATYRAVYQPAYRVVSAAYAAVLPLLVQMEQLAPEGRKVIAIDGRCGAGKTTLAALLAPVLEAQQIHLDDFFLPPTLRSAARLAEPGGNLHYERFAEEVLPGLQQATPFTYRRFTCRLMDYDGSCKVEGEKNVIVEGSYAMRPEFRTAYDVSIFCDIPPALQTQRILKRNGPDWYHDFETRWIPMEERYFDLMQVRKACNIVLPMETLAL